MKIGILGTRGIPNYHGGFEQFAEFFAVYAKNKGHDVYVYNSSDHPFQDSDFKGVHIIHCYDPENKIGTSGQFIYDLNCILDARKRKFDVLLQLGYTSSSIWCKLLPKQSIVVTNMDGLEWKRSKYSKPVQKFLKYAEKLAVKSSDFLISDSLGIQAYLKSEYQADSEFIAYGANIFERADEDVINQYEVEPNGYDMLIARMEPENNIEVILDGANAATHNRPFLVIGKTENNFGTYLTNKYKDNPNIRFLGGIYNLEHLNNLRYFSNLYFHGHSVGGTNPSLLEAMASNTLIVANDNPFNKSIVRDNGFYFTNSEEVKNYLQSIKKSEYMNLVEGSKRTIITDYQWDKINHEYLTYLSSLTG